MSARTLYAEVATAYDCTLRGYGSRELLTAASNGRPPVWSRSRKAWSCQESTLRDALAAAEREGFHIVITGPRAAAARPANCAAPCTVDEPPVEHVDPGEGLW